MILGLITPTSLPMVSGSVILLKVMKNKSLRDMKDLIQVKYYFKEHPNTTLSVFLKTEEQVEAFKAKHPDYVYVGETK
jgi:hypothetical protein